MFGGDNVKQSKLKLISLTILIVVISFLTSIILVQYMNVYDVRVIVALTIVVTMATGFVVVRAKILSDDSLEAELKEQTKIRSSILNLTQNMTTIHSISELHDMILETAVDVLPHATMGSIMILQDDNSLKFTSVVGFKLEELQAIDLRLEDSYLYHETDGIVDKTVIVDNAQAVNATIPGEANAEIVNTTNTDLINTTITSPLYIEGQLYGMMNVDSETEHAFSEGDVDLMNFFANEAIKVIKLYETIEENNRLSKFDPLTNLYNRRYLHHRLKKLTNEAEQFTLVSIDINNLKEVNDKYGHDLGDELLMKFVSGISYNLSKHDLFSRYGGDEFIVVYHNKTKDKIEELYKDTILPYFKNEIVHEDMEDVRVSFSYGITCFPIDAKNYEKLLIKADQLMYSSKREFHMQKALKE